MDITYFSLYSVLFAIFCNKQCRTLRIAMICKIHWCACKKQRSIIAWTVSCNFNHCKCALMIFYWGILFNSLFTIIFRGISCE